MNYEGEFLGMVVYIIGIGGFELIGNMCQYNSASYCPSDT